MGYVIGIDVGTTYTAAAVSHGDARSFSVPEVVSLGARTQSTATVAFLAPDGGWMIGDAAERRAHERPDLVVREFKRRIGDPVPLVVDGQRHRPEALVAAVVRWVVDRVAEREGGPAVGITVTHPASWGSYKRALVHDAMAEVGLPDVQFLSEPVAAAAHYATQARVEVGSTIAVYDLGGGTFDAAIVRKVDERSFELLGTPQGIDRLGGVDFDQAVLGHVHTGTSMPPIDPTDPDAVSAMVRLRRECTEAKEALSADTETTIPVLLPTLRTRVRLVRSEFEELVRNAVEDTVDALQSTIESAGVAPDGIDAVLLVGGSSRIPLVAQVISARLGRPIVVDADPKSSIALGAASTAAAGVRPLEEPRPPRPVVAIAGTTAAAPVTRVAVTSQAPLPTSTAVRRHRLPARIGAGAVAASIGVAAVAGALVVVVWPADGEDGRPAVVEAQPYFQATPSTAVAPGSVASGPAEAVPVIIPVDLPAAVPTAAPLLNAIEPTTNGTSVPPGSGDTTTRPPPSSVTAAALPIPLVGTAIPALLSTVPAAGAAATETTAAPTPNVTVPGAVVPTGTVASTSPAAPAGTTPALTAAPGQGPTSSPSSRTDATAPAAPSRTTIPPAPPRTTSPAPTSPTPATPATEPPATAPRTTEPPATQPPATQPPATEPPATQPPATQPPATEPPTTEPAATEPSASDPPTTDPPADITPSNDPGVERSQTLGDETLTDNSTGTPSDPTDVP